MNFDDNISDRMLRSTRVTLLWPRSSVSPSRKSFVQADTLQRFPPLELFAGTYGSVDTSGDIVVTFTPRQGDLLMHPALWSGPMVLRRITADSFVVSTHPRFAARFIRGSDGDVTSARIHGLSPDVTFVPLDPDSPRSIQLLLEGRPREAARRYVAADTSGTDRFVTVGRRFLQSAPTRVAEAVSFFVELSRLLPNEAAIHAALGDALVFADRRTVARKAYHRSLSLDPSNETAATACWDGANSASTALMSRHWPANNPPALVRGG